MSGGSVGGGLSGDVLAFSALIVEDSLEDVAGDVDGGLVRVLILRVVDC